MTTWDIREDYSSITKCGDSRVAIYITNISELLFKGTLKKVIFITELYLLNCRQFLGRAVISSNKLLVLNWKWVLLRARKDIPKTNFMLV